jgi:protein involved in sex pheromone biosynthesis
MIKKIVLICLSLILVSCSNSSEEISTDEGLVNIDSYDKTDYSISVPFDLSNARKWHGDSLSRLDQIEIPKGLQNYSKDYFNVDDNFMQQGSVLTKDDILMLQRRQSDDYPYALNPESGLFELTTAQTVDSPYIVYDVVELDYVDKKDSSELSGISLAIVMNSTVNNVNDASETTYTIDDDRLYKFASVAGRKLELYMRTKEDVSPDLPIYISFYSAKDDESYLPGKFIGGGLFEGRSGQFQEIDEEWYLLPTTEHTEFDGILASGYAIIKGEVNVFLPQNVSMIAKAKYINNSLDYLKIDIVMQAKTYTEMYALTQYVNSLSNEIITKEYDLIIDIKQNDESVFTITKEKGSLDTVINDLT